MKILLLLATYLYYSVVLAQLPVIVSLSLTAISLPPAASDCNNSFLYYSSVTEDLSQDKMAF